MAKRKRSARTDPAPVEQPAPAEDPFATQVFTSSGNLALHELFQQQAMRMLENSDLTEEQKQEWVVPAIKGEKILCLGITGLLVLVAAAAVGLVRAAPAAGSLLVDWDFTLRDEGERLAAARGLLTRRLVHLDLYRLESLEGE